MLIFDVNKNDESVWSEPESQKWEVNVMPNPSNGELRIQLNTIADEPWQIEVYTQSALNAGQNVVQADWSNFAKGLYLIRIMQNNRIETHRLVVN